MFRRLFIPTLVALGTALMVTSAFAQKFELTPGMQAELDRQKTAIAGWAASPTIVTAVLEQNQRGPIPGMDNPKWKQTRRLYEAEKAEVEPSRDEVVLTNEMVYAKARHELGRDGRKTTPAPHSQIGLTGPRTSLVVLPKSPPPRMPPDMSMATRGSGS